MAGLTAARELTQHGWTVTVLDKGRGVGGRMATRRIEQAKADHGAPYFAVTTPEFQAVVDPLIARGVVTEWPLGEPHETGTVVPRPTHRRYVGVGGMNTVAKELANGLTVMLSERVVAVTAEASGWLARTESGEEYYADSLVITIPAPQALTLLHDSGFDLAPADHAALSAIGYQPCLTVLAALRQPSNIPAPGDVYYETGDVSWVIDNRQKGISPDQPSVTIHASPDFSRAHFDDDLNAVGQQLLGQLNGLIPREVVSTVQTHRWRYSRAIERHPAPFLVAQAPLPLLFGGDGFGDGNVEGAFTSGLRMAEYLIGR